MFRPLRILLTLVLIGAAGVPGALAPGPVAAASTLEAGTLDASPHRSGDAEAGSVGVTTEEDVTLSGGDLATVVGLGALLVIGSGAVIGVEVRRRRLRRSRSRRD